MEVSADRAIADLVQAKADASAQKVAFAVAAKQLDLQKSQGEALVSLVENARIAQQQIATGRLDVRV